jgi:manganese efflux pump family protein
MGLATLILIAIGLSVDSFAVSVSCGLIMFEISFRKATRIAFSLAFFQALMPLIGWHIGRSVAHLVERYDHWIAFGLLTAIGGKMVLDSFRDDKDANKVNPLDLKVLLGISIATSIDAFIIGISFAFVKIDLLLATIIIGITTFFFSMLGILFGKKTGSRLGKNLEIIGGIFLILIGLKILIEHLNA